jgi:hypothetical protein
MNNHNEIEIFYIEDIIFENNDLVIYLNKYLPPYFFNEFDKLTIVKIKIVNCNCNLTIEDIKHQIDPHEDGIIYEIYKTEINTTIKTIDMGGRTMSISGEEIIKTEIPYSIDQIWNALSNYKQSLENSNNKIIELTKRIERLEKHVDKEIENIDSVINSKPVDTILLKWNIKKDIWLKVKRILKND